MTVRYVSYDLKKGSDYGDLRAFIKKHKGVTVTRSLYRFESEVELDQFRAELREAAGDDDSVCLIVRTKEGIAHGRAGARTRAL